MPAQWDSVNLRFEGAETRLFLGLKVEEGLVHFVYDKKFFRLGRIVYACLYGLTRFHGILMYGSLIEIGLMKTGLIKIGLKTGKMTEEVERIVNDTEKKDHMTCNSTQPNTKQRSWQTIPYFPKERPSFSSSRQRKRQMRKNRSIPPSRTALKRTFALIWLHWKKVR